MQLHKEGHQIILSTCLIMVGLNVIYFSFYDPTPLYRYLIIAASALLIGLVVQFFRIPERIPPFDNESDILAPADGKVVAFEEVEETEYFLDKRIKISIFMSPLVPHLNWYPIQGIIEYFKYHPGRFLVAWHPKSSSENECTTIVIKQDEQKQVLCRQIAGALARRIRYYFQEGDKVTRGNEMGFIKFGSRVDIFLPLGSKIFVEMDQQVTGSETILARFA